MSPLHPPAVASLPLPVALLGFPSEAPRSLSRTLWLSPPDVLYMFTALSAPVAPAA